MAEPSLALMFLRDMMMSEGYESTSGGDSGIDEIIDVENERMSNGYDVYDDMPNLSNGNDNTDEILHEGERTRRVDGFTEVENTYKTYEERLQTFSTWTNKFPAPFLARAGFIYTNRDDIVICPRCGVEGFRWKDGDDPLADHLKWSPTCSFFKNVFPWLIRKNSQIFCKKYITPESRLNTFDCWPILHEQYHKAESLAAAGFFYTGQWDRIRCFFCGIGIEMLLADDDITKRHVKANHRCEYLQFLQQNEKKEEEERLHREKRNACAVCLTKEICILVLPCRHVATCGDCTLQMETCCICRTPITMYFPIFLV